jgi:site-specific DNA-methyltransferase (adenine-specific)
VGRRESHDASGFYDRFTAPVLSAEDEVAPSPIKDKIIAGDARNMSEVEDRSVALVVTSPPYFAGKEYEEALGEGHIPASYLDYLAMLEAVFAECVRTLEPGGRIAVNVANLGRKPYRSLSADVIAILQDRLGLLLRGEVIWHKAKGASGSCAWGSFRSPANPVLRDLTERIVIASKGRFDRAHSARERHRRGLPSGITLTKDEFIEATTDVWEIPSERATRVGHPAPFPVELPLRLIELYTYEGDLVLDPLMGSGSTAAAAVRTRRHYVGYDTESEYVRIAEQRVREERDRTNEREERSGGSLPIDDAVQARRDGHGARQVAGELLRSCGFTDVREGPRPVAGVDVSFSGRDRSGRTWLFDLAGAFTTAGTGLRRADALWRSLGKAAVVHAAVPEMPLVLLTTAAPPANSAGEHAWRSLAGFAPDGSFGAVFDVIELDSADTRLRLSGYAADGPRPPADDAPASGGTRPRRTPRAR